MKKTYLILLLTAFLGTGCKKDPVRSAPKSDFTIDGKSGTTTTLAQGVYTYMSNSSKNSISYLWDFGDGNTSSDQDVLFRFKKAGTYTVSLTSKNSDGQTSVVKKQVKVLTAVVNSISITNLSGLAYGVDPDVPKLSKADVWVEIRKSEKGMIINEVQDGTDNVSLVYTSPIFRNVTPTSNVTLNIANTVIDLLALGDRRYLVTLYAKDETGKTYRLFNNSYSTSDNSYGVQVENNSFLWIPSFLGYRIELKGKFQ